VGRSELAGGDGRRSIVEVAVGRGSLRRGRAHLTDAVEWCGSWIVGRTHQKGINCVGSTGDG
jgi:hypothetical protein